MHGRLLHPTHLAPGHLHSPGVFCGLQEQLQIRAFAQHRVCSNTVQEHLSAASTAQHSMRIPHMGMSLSTCTQTSSHAGAQISLTHCEGCCLQHPVPGQVPTEQWDCMRNQQANQHAQGHVSEALPPVQFVWQRQHASCRLAWPRTCSARRLSSMNSLFIWNFCTAFFSGRGGMMTPLRTPARPTPSEQLQTRGFKCDMRASAFPQQQKGTQN